MDAQYWKQRNQLLSLLLLSFGFLVQLSLQANQVNAQDILRRTLPQPQSQHQHQLNQAAANNNGRGQSLSSPENALANLQLPPQLASLTPAQLHQLAQLRELQLQQQAAAAAQQDQQSAPAPIGAESLTPTAQPASIQSNGAQIPMPQSQSSTEARGRTNVASEANDKHDDGAYNESSSEMEGVMQSGANGEAGQAGAQPSQTGAGSPEASSAPATASAPTFEVNWNKCPQLEPSESEKSKKTQVITKCLQSSPIPTNLTRENVENHREQIATCALRVEGWFDEQGDYRYEKAESEIKGKKLDQAIENQVLKFHIACKEESNKKFPRNQNKLIDQVQFYQACMDYYISIVCEIEVSVDQ